AAGTVQDPVAQPVARTVADVGVRGDAAGGVADRDRDRLAVLHRLRAAVWAGHSVRCRLAQTAHVRLADTPVVAVSLEPGPARRSGPGGDTGGAGQIVVSDSAAVRVATGEVGGPGPRAGDAAHAGGWDPLRDRHRGSQHPVRLHLRVQFLHRTLFRRVGVHRRICLPRLFEAAENGAQPAVTVV